MFLFRGEIATPKLIQNLALSVIAFAAFAANSADFSGSATMPGGAKIDFQNVAATNWVGGELVLKYTTVGGTHGFTLPGSAIADVLVVGGGGAGGSGISGSSRAETGGKGVGGGGGAGGMIDTNDFVLASGTYVVSVGEGGRPGDDASGTTGGDGQDTMLKLNDADVLRAYGGGGGGADSVGSGTIAGSKNIGSGGGGSAVYSGGTLQRDGGAGTVGQGYAGGNGVAARTAGGGGGAGGVGANGSVLNEGAKGGVGKASTIWNGSQIYYAGGGGSGSQTGTGGQGGSGIGGNGGGGTSGTGIAATAGAAETGSGGGGGTLTKAGAAGGSGVVIVRISAALPGPLAKPVSQTNTYDGVTHVLVEKTMAYSVSVNGAPVDRVEGRNAGTYPAHVRLNDGFGWADGTDGELDIELVIEKATVTITDLHMDSWAVKPAGSPLPEPTCTVSIPDANPVYKYGTTTAFEEATGTKPTQPGQYYVFAEVPAANNWNRTVSDPAPFSIFEQPSTIFEDHVEIDIAPYVPAAGEPKELTNFPYRIVLSPTSPVGFDYVRAGATGEDLAFADEDGNVLNHEVISWDPTGDSVVYVRIPWIDGTGAKIVLYWKPAEGKTPPAYDPDPVWSDWTKAKADAFPHTPGKSFGVVETDGKKVDYWVDRPELSKTSWGVTTDPGECGTITTNGSLRSGRPIAYAIYDADSGEPLDDPKKMPMDEGVYYILFFARDAAPEYIEPDPQRIDIRVIARAPYYDLSDGAATQTLGGRILLANADTNVDHAIAWDEGQAYWQVREVKDGIYTHYYTTYWTHSGDFDTSATFPNMRDGADHDLKHIEGESVTNTLWRLRDIRIGNTFSRSGSMPAGQCFLPTSPTALAISSYANATNQGKTTEVGQLLMRNLRNAAVYSPCYTNGIGTIYFDAVNAQTTDAGKGVYRFVVEIATETKDHLPPTDANAGEELENITDAQWQPATITVLQCVNGAFIDPVETNEMDLTVTTGGGDRNWYRLFVKQNRPGPIRFRIRRTMSSTSTGADKGRFIVLDNILVSFPTSDAKIEPYGVFDPEKSGKQTLGLEGAMANLPFPAAGQDVFARAKAITNAVPGVVADPATFIQLSKFHYQWHYLGQASNGWHSVDLRPQGGFVADEPLRLPAEAGDVEFWFETFTKIPFYDYVDYSGTGLRLGGRYTEEVGLTYYPADALAGGRCFVRLREGVSGWDVVNVLLQTTGFAVDEPMELVADHQWRGLVKIPTNVLGEVSFSFRGGSYWAPGGTEPAQQGVTWYPTEPATNRLPARGATTLAGGPKPFLADGATGFMEFQFNDETGLFTLGHAEYQNFNVWHDARTTNETFVGTYPVTSGVSVAAMVTTNAHMATWETLRTTDSNWDEDFYLSNYESEAYRKNVVFKTHKMPHQWNGDNGMFVDANLTGTSAKDREQSSGLAWQMQSFGVGSVSFTQGDVPNGLDTVTFRARLQQSLAFEDFSYCFADGMMQTNNYTFLIPAVLSTSSSRGMADDFAPGASMSVVGYYQPMVGCYEFRVSRDDNANLRFAIYKWRRQGYRMTVECLGAHLFGSAAFWHTDGSSAPNMFAMFISLGEDAAGATTIIGGLSTAAKVPNDPYSGSDTKYRAIRCVDDDNATRFTSGSIGALSTSCNGLFLTARLQSEHLLASGIKDYAHDPSTAEKTDYPKFMSYYDNNTVITIPGSRRETLDLARMESWACTPGRVELYANENYGWGTTPYGLRPPADLGQTLDLYLKASKTGSTSGDDAAWTLVASNRVTSYGWKDYSITVRTNESCHVMLKPGDAPADVAVGNITQSGWNGADMVNPPDNDFMFTQARVYDDISSDKTKTNRYCALQPARASAAKPLSIRAPILDHGMGMLGFKYKDVKPGAEVWVQMSTNDVRMTGTYGLNQSLREGSGVGEWETIRRYPYDELVAGGGELQHFVGLHDVVGNPVKGVFRILVPPSVVSAAAGVTMTDPTYGSITVTDIWVQDEPALDTGSWLGWNLRILGDAKDAERRMFLPDPSTTVEGGASGLSSALNNSTTDGIPEGRNPSEYSMENPTIQSPMFKAGSIGYVRFRARVYDNSGIVGQPAKVTLYGVMDSSQGDWGSPIETFDVDSPRFKQFEYRAGAKRFAAIRLAVDGVVTNGTATGKAVARVLLDEVIVSEKSEASVGFAYARPFRSHLETDDPLPESEVLGMSEQPLTDESWGVQAKVRLDQFDQDIDLDRGLRVTFRYFTGETPWGYEAWRDDDRASVEVDLKQVGEAEDLVFRSTSDKPRTIVKPTLEPNTTVQYVLTVYYHLKNDPTEYPSLIEVVGTEGQGWTNPTWYSPIDKNEGKSDKVPYTILDGMSPGRVWINEVNYNDGTEDENGGKTITSNQFLEIAVPWNVDIRNWYLRLTDMYGNSTDLATFGLNKVPSKKASGVRSGDYGFLVLESPKSTVLDQETGKAVADGKWSSVSLSSTLDSGTLKYGQPYQFELYRPSGILEHQFVVAGTNVWRLPKEYFDSFGYRYEGTNLLNDLDALDPNPKRFFAGEDLSRKPDGTLWSSIGVTGGAHGEEGGWSNAMRLTPGRLNEDQDELSGWYLRPNGGSIWVYALVEAASRGNVRQWIGEDDAQDTHVIVRSGEATNICYGVRPWYAVRAVGVNEAGETNYTFVGTGGNAVFNLNNVTETTYVTAREDIDPKLLAAGLDPNDPYTPAVQRWMRDSAENGRFENAEGPLANAVYRDLSADATNCPLSLKEMYWFDLDPTQPGWWMRGGYVDLGIKNRIRKFNDRSEVPYANPQIGVKMYFSNEFAKVDRACGKSVFGPYRLQGLNNERSDTYASNWTSVTFKVEGQLMNGMEHNIGWVPFRWFTFGPESFLTPEAAEKAGRPAYTADIEVLDPFSQESPGYFYGWWRYRDKAMTFHWNISEQIQVNGVEKLKADSTYEDDSRFKH